MDTNYKRSTAHLHFDDIRGAVSASWAGALRAPRALGTPRPNGRLTARVGGEFARAAAQMGLLSHIRILPPIIP